MAPTNDSHSFMFSAFRLIFLSRFPFKGCLWIASSLTFLFPILRLTSATHYRKGVRSMLPWNTPRCSEWWAQKPTDTWQNTQKNNGSGVLSDHCSKTHFWHYGEYCCPEKKKVKYPMILVLCASILESVYTRIFWPTVNVLSITFCGATVFAVPHCILQQF